jgi:hypothetical protein
MVCGLIIPTNIPKNTQKATQNLLKISYFLFSAAGNTHKNTQEHPQISIYISVYVHFAGLANTAKRKYDTSEARWTGSFGGVGGRF